MNLHSILFARMRFAKRLTLTAVLIAAMAGSTVVAEEYRYAVGIGGGLAQTSGGDLFSFDSDISFGLSLGGRLSDRWQLELDASLFTLGNDTTVAAADSTASLANNIGLDFKATRIGLRFDRKLFDARKALNITAGFGGGMLWWKGNDPAGDSVYQIRNDRGGLIDFAANELFFTGALGLLVKPSARTTLHIVGQADYLTGAGAAFESGINDGRDRLLLKVQARLSYHFGSTVARQAWTSETQWTSREASRTESESVAPRGDSDADGVEDRNDNCPGTPRGAVVDRRGCPVDSDSDGVPDGLDDCVGTPVDARRKVDIHGCPVDADFDGLADYLDKCPNNLPGALVDETGCPIDGDGDGVPDGLDDCPYTLVGVAVDKHGCIELSMLSEPMVLNIDYPPGSFEVDPHNRTRLERLAGLLNFVKDIRLDISGYTDDIGTPSANRSLSEKRANRVKGILVSLGVEEDRIKVFGRGESDFVASNQTAEGRAMNRRIEIVFYR